MNELIDKNSGILINSYKGPSIKNILPDKWTQHLSKFSNKDTYTTTINNMYDSIQKIIKMKDEDKKRLRENAYTKSIKDYNFFEKNMIKLL